MTAYDLIQYVSSAFSVVIFVHVAIKAFRRPLPANIDILLYFTVFVLVIAMTVLTRLGYIPPDDPLASGILVSGVLSMAYLLVRLVEDFSKVPRWVKLLSRSEERRVGKACCV